MIGGVLAALGITAFFVVRLGLRPLSRIEVTAGEIAAGDLSRRVSPATTKTEVGRLGLALNAMLDRLEQAFAARTASEERLRQFLADASHELRTPLASIRGYAELFRLGAVARPRGHRERDAPDRGRVEAHGRARRGPAGARAPGRAARARGAEPSTSRPSRATPSHDARARAPEREISLSAGGAAIVSGDPLQLRQVFANLLGNAIVHTPAGTPIEVAVDASGDSVTVRVSDHGPGVPEDERRHLFERFWRREGGRERGRAGAGLGLAIVQGVVGAHHGSIEVRDVPGGGAAFVVTLPRRDSA